MTNASGTRAAAPFARCAIASSAASDGLGGQAYWHAVPPSINCWVARPRRRSVAGRRAPWGSGRLALGRSRRSAAAAQITPLASRCVPHQRPGSAAPPPYPCTWRRRAAPERFHRLPSRPPHPTPTPLTTATTTPACLSRPSRTAPCHRPASLDRSTGNSNRPLPTQTPPLFCSTR